MQPYGSDTSQGYDRHGNLSKLDPGDRSDGGGGTGRDVLSLGPALAVPGELRGQLELRGLRRARAHDEPLPHALPALFLHPGPLALARSSGRNAVEPAVA